MTPTETPSAALVSVVDTPSPVQADTLRAVAEELTWPLARTPPPRPARRRRCAIAVANDLGSGPRTPARPDVDPETAPTRTDSKTPMTNTTSALGELPRRAGGARRATAHQNRPGHAGRRIAVLDDDPTGSQTVHDVAVVTVFDADEIAAGLDEPGSTCFILTNTRSMGEADAIALTTRVGRTLFELSERLGRAHRRRQPQRLHAARTRHRRGHRSRRGPPRGARARLRRGAADSGLPGGRPVHRRGRALGPGRRRAGAGRGDRVRP